MRAHISTYANFNLYNLNSSKQICPRKLRWKRTFDMKEPIKEPKTQFDGLYKEILCESDLFITASKLIHKNTK